jgi:hypothetical protein
VAPRKRGHFHWHHLQIIQILHRRDWLKLCSMGRGTGEPFEEPGRAGLEPVGCNYVTSVRKLRCTQKFPLTNPRRGGHHNHWGMFSTAKFGDIRGMSDRFNLPPQTSASSRWSRFFPSERPTRSIIPVPPVRTTTAAPSPSSATPSTETSHKT